MIGPYELDTIVVGNSTELIEAVPDESVDLVVTSPPYNLGDRYAGQSPAAIGGKWTRVIQYDEYQDNLPEDEYREWQQGMLRQMWRVLKPTGAIFYNHRPRIQNGQVQHRLDLIPAEVCLRQIIVWERPGGHNFNPGYFVPSYEWIFLIAKPEFRLLDSGWSDVWQMDPPDNDHPAPFPLELPFRAIKCSANVQIVLDPYIGSGTTGEAARLLSKNYLGFELVEAYAEQARLKISGREPVEFAPGRSSQLVMGL